MVKKKPTLKEQQKKEEENKNKKDKKLQRDVAVLRSLLNNNFNGIADQGDRGVQGVIDELNGLRELYPITADGIDKLRFLIISIIDIIHDAHGSRVGFAARVNHLPLFKIVVCNIFGISERLYDYISARVVPVTQDVLKKFIEGSVQACNPFTAEAYFDGIYRRQGAAQRQQGVQRPLSVTTTILRD
jgi:hypothetical protein